MQFERARKDSAADLQSTSTKELRLCNSWVLSKDVKFHRLLRESMYDLNLRLLCCMNEDPELQNALARSCRSNPPKEWKEMVNFDLPILPNLLP